MRDNKGQLLLLAVVFLAITLIVLASAATVFLNVKQNQMNGSFADEYDNIKEKFGFALNEKANIYNESGMSKADAINRSFNETKNDFETLLSYKGFDFDAECMVDGDNVSVNISITSSSQTLTETVKYTVIWEEAGLPYNPSGYTLLNFTTHTSGVITNLSSDNGQPMVFGSYVSGEQDDEEDYVDSDASDVDVSADKGTHSNFENEKAKDSNYDTLTEENTGGGAGVGGDANANSKDIVNTGYYGGPDDTGDAVTDLQAADWSSGSTNGLYIVADNAIMYINGFDTTGMSGTVTSAVLHLRYSTENGFGATNAIMWALTDGGDWTTTGIAPSDTTTSSDYDAVSADQTYTFSPTPTLAQVGSMCINYHNNDGAAPDDIGFDYMYITVTVTGGADNYELDLEVQFTSVNYTKEFEELCIYTGTTNAENLDVDVWTGSWTNIRTITSSDNDKWNNVSVSSYLTSSTFTIRFHGTSESLDTTQSTWQIDAVLLHTWNNTYKLEVEFNGSSNALSWSQLIWTIDSQWNKSSVEVTFQLYNYTADRYALSSEDGYISYISGAAGEDELKEQTITNNPENFRNATDDWKVKITGVRVGASFSFSADWVEFKVQTS